MALALTILAVLTEPETARACLHAAGVAAAADHSARVRVVHVRVPAEQLILPSEEVLTAQRRQQLEKDAARRSHALEAAVEKWRQGAGPLSARVEWLEVVGSVESEVAAQARSADLLVLARPAGIEGREALHAAIFEARQLCLVAPPAPPAPFGRHPAIAWKDSDQAQRAIVAALPWLRHAERVSLLMAIKGTEALEPPHHLLSLLERERVAVERLTVLRGHGDVGEQLLREAQLLGADCLVMGAYRHSRLVEAILGGVTRHVLHHAEIPALLLH